eukprot:c14159_g1_i1.p1 GENE.c14159_g1_i1~~c14159_g1_i1.p1  ORF type:complete len:374 (+),score=77.49 c14159_g1_i1:168-1124(+)
MISEAEFAAYFADGVLSHVELMRLFRDIDKDNSKQLDHIELRNWFSASLKPFEPVFAALLTVNAAVAGTLLDVAKDYDSLPYFDQFRQRFFLKEVYKTLEAILFPVDRAVDALEDKSRRASDSNLPFTPAHQATVVGTAPTQVGSSGGRSGGASTAAAERAGAGASGAAASSLGELKSQVDRLRAYMDRLDRYEAHADFSGLTTEAGGDEPDELYWVVQREYEVLVADAPAFVNAARTYLENTRHESNNCLHLFMKARQGSRGRFYGYEIWATAEALAEHYQGDAWKGFARETIDVLAAPVTSKKLPMPAAWWVASVD